MSLVLVTLVVTLAETAEVPLMVAKTEVIETP